MKLLVLSSVYLLIISVFGCCCFGHISFVLLAGENLGVNYLHDWNILV